MPPGDEGRVESRRGEEGPELRRRGAPKEEPGPGGGVGQIHNPGSRSVEKVRVQKAGWGGARAKEAGSGRSQVWEATWGGVRLRKTAGGGARAQGTSRGREQRWKARPLWGREGGTSTLEAVWGRSPTKGRRLSRES